MKIKSYYSHTVEDAMASARQELGPEAMLVNTRKTPVESRHLGEYEVVFATLQADGCEPESGGAQSGSTGHTRAVVSGDRLSVEVAELKQELEGMRRALNRTAYAPPQWTGVPQDVSDAFDTLTAAEVSADLARDIVQSAGVRLQERRGAGSTPAAHPEAGGFQRALVEELENRFSVDSALGSSASTARIVALAGPPGSGKTTTLVKLAVNYGLAARRGVLLLSMDTHRVAAADQLRSYAAILGVGFQVLGTVGALAQTIEENRGKELIFIDTPGFARGELKDETGLTHLLKTRSDIDTHLVLPASMKPADVSRVVAEFNVLGPQHLLFTRLDETGSYGSILNEAIRSGKPLSFFTTGQRIPEDIEAATRQRLLDSILDRRGGKVRSAA
ncbi:MAG TPA: hypothetical protein VMJ75_29480 [Candidatus Acidoferrales bacterium]|nr:hypothetical protein [Candidatus Acidoferrales bacterium]